MARPTSRYLHRSHLFVQKDLGRLVEQSLDQLVGEPLPERVATYAASYPFSRRSTIHGPNGIIAAVKIRAARDIGQRAAIQVCTSDTQKITNRIPCAIPAMRTASGSPAIYFNGIAMNNRTRNEIPSIRATVRNMAIGFFIEHPKAVFGRPNLYRRSVPGKFAAFGIRLAFPLPAVARSNHLSPRDCAWQSPPPE